MRGFRWGLLIPIALGLALPGVSYAQVKKDPITAEFLIGRWGDNGDCSKDVVLRADGTFSSYTGGGGRWVLTGDRLVLTGANGEYVLRVERDDDDTLVITNPDGSVGRSQRC